MGNFFNGWEKPTPENNAPETKFNPALALAAVALLVLIGITAPIWWPQLDPDPTTVPDPCAARFAVLQSRIPAITGGGFDSAAVNRLMQDQPFVGELGSFVQGDCFEMVTITGKISRPAKPPTAGDPLVEGGDSRCKEEVLLHIAAVKTHVATQYTSPGAKAARARSLTIWARRLCIECGPEMAAAYGPQFCPRLRSIPFEGSVNWERTIIFGL